MKAPVVEKHFYDDDTQKWDLSNFPPLPLPVHTKMTIIHTLLYTVSLKSKPPSSYVCCEF